ncbi:hypothetical protein SJR98_18450 [Aeromonas hydrophila]|uniref:hypothetical protein n=1 Tax=Aeromonas hydrophila TaxID=644 RepID=UPI0029DBD564|nr:hypothetical protein [Aeromonas hydrophila]MDX7780064.1 hypothetical protein [Aeromonas hydrophila]
MKNTRNHLSLATSIIILAAVMVIWPNLFLWSKVVHLPDWAEHLPAPVFTGSYVSFVCLIPAALGADNFSSAKRVLFVAVVVTPLFAVATYALNPEHQNEHLLFNVVFHYIWIILFCMLIPAAILAAIKKIIGSRGTHS